MFHIAGNAVMGNEFRDQLKASIVNVFETHASEDRVQGFMRRRQMTQLFDKVINAGNRFGLYVDPANLTVLKASITYMQTIGLIAEHDNSTKNFDILQRIFTYVVETADKTGVAKSTSGKPLSTDAATQLFADWISAVADRDPFLYQNLTGRINI
jgi:hypothetical protein